MDADADAGADPTAAGSARFAELGRVTGFRVERTIEIVAGFGCAVLGAQALVAAISGVEPTDVVHPALELLLFVPLAIMVVACFVGRLVKAASAIFAIIGAVGIAVWPLVHISAESASPQQPWIFFLVSVITTAAVLAFPLTWQIVWTVIVPIEWLLIRTVPPGVPAEDVPAALMDASFALVFGAVLVTLAWLFRHAAATVDRRRAVADAAYADAVAADAAEQERLAVGALMHDSVLSALIAAARAQSQRERTLAVSMASEALTRLADAEHDPEIGPGAPVALIVVAHRLENAAETLGAPIEVRCTGAGAVPGVVARALVLAGVQAIANAVAHADAAGLTASVTASGDPLTVRVEVRDAGDGFDVSAVPEDRLGISASIVARMSAVRGRGQVRSGAEGTAVMLEWQAGR